LKLLDFSERKQLTGLSRTTHKPLIWLRMSPIFDNFVIESSKPWVAWRWRLRQSSGK